MQKKVVDIISPKRKEIRYSSLGPKEKEGRKPRIKRPKFRVPLSSTSKKALVFGLPILILAGIFCYFTLSKANFEIWPESETLTLKTKLTVDKEVEESDFLAKVIPGKVFEKEKTITEKFPSSGKVLKEGKAEGILRVYNEYSTYSQVLIKRTRFVSTEGKLFRTPTRVTIPGGHYEKGKLIPGEIDIKVVADEAGPEYNIGPSTFSIPGFAGTDRYTKFYAKSFQPMTGGFIEEVPQITKEDLETAKNILTKKAREESEKAFKNELRGEEISSEFNFLERAIETEIVETFSLAKAGEEAEDFNFQVKTKSKTLLFKKTELENFAKEFINSQITEGKKLYEKSLKIDFKPETIDLNSGKIILSLEISAKIYSDIDIPNLKNALKGKSLPETKILFENQPEITKVEIEFWPFWVRKVPKDLDKINFNLRVD
jgi:hypothetical protein